MVIRDGKIIALGATGVVVPKDAVVIDCKDKYIYPSFVDIYTDYGVAPAGGAAGAGGRGGGGGGFGNTPPQITSNKTGPYGWNQALKPEAWNDNQSLPQIFDADDKWNDLRAFRIGKEFGTQYIIKAGGNEYQRIKEIADTKASFILSLNFPQAMDVEDPNDARAVSLGDMKHWELAPTNPAAFEKANISFCLTTADLRDPKQFLTNLRKAIEMGLSETRAMDALTKTPATLLGVYDKVGSLETGKLANFLITSGPIFSATTTILHNWVHGGKYAIKEDAWYDVKGMYNLTINTPAGAVNYSLDVKSASVANVIGKDTLTGRFTFDGKMVKLNFSPIPARRPGGGNAGGGFGGGRGGAAAAAPTGPQYRLSGVSSGTNWNGTGEDTAGNKITWSASFASAVTASTDTAARRRPAGPQRLAKVTFPFDGYGWEEAPKQEDLLIKNATVWTSEKEGKLENTDVLLKGGKISKIGKNLSDAGAKVIDATGKHVTAGIIDEHSHIAAASINEGGQSVTSEVRIADNLNPEDINIYRQLSGGVTSSHILHGSANTIGGQTQLIKLRWGANDDDLKFKGSDGFIKFALGENITNVGTNISAASGATVIDAKGKHVYPGLILPSCDLGLKEIGAGVRASNDVSELGDFNSNIRSITAYNTDSRVIAVLRSNGILLAGVTPEGGLISGSSSVVQLDAWNWEDAAYKMDAAIHLRMPSFINRFGRRGGGGPPGGFPGGFGGAAGADPARAALDRVESIKAFFREAKGYLQETAHTNTNLKFEAVKGKTNVDRYRLCKRVWF
ncbi:unnamed protein product [Rotaria sordida]|uniref:dihydropyrimidinase n=1 Tax=Rotaria sordida TaxID=392033 RepID=A0A813WSL2_9BILA|nr:unnamed protein product [Rotaria sordida]